MSNKKNQEAPKGKVTYWLLPCIHLTPKSLTLILT